MQFHFRGGFKGSFMKKDPIFNFLVFFTKNNFFFGLTFPGVGVFKKLARCARLKDRAWVGGKYALKTPRVSGNGVQMSIFCKFHLLKINIFYVFLCFSEHKTDILGDQGT